MAKTSSKKSAVFGKLTLEHRNDLLAYGSSDHRGVAIEICFMCSDEAAFTTLLPRAEKFWKKRSVHFKTAREYRCNELLVELNECLDCGQDAPVQFTANQLRKALRVPRGLTFWNTDSEVGVFVCDIYLDHDKIEDHVLRVCFTEDGTVAEGEVKCLL